MTRALSVVFFLSGASALVFETLWFRQAGVVLGNSVWAGSLVLASFMGGLALGNALAARYGHRLRDALRFYAGLELAIGLLGVGVVLLFPQLNAVLRPVFQSTSESLAATNLIRLGVAFLLLLGPTAAMGATLPVVVQGLCSRKAVFGQVLGLLYGWNTLGAVAGALVTELVLIRWLGISGTGMAAAACNTVAALMALVVAWRLPAPSAERLPQLPAMSAPMTFRRVRLLAAAFLSGGAFLALEVVWFRFLQLFTFGSSLNFAVMLAVVLSGIGLGGLLAARWLRAGAVGRLLPAAAFGCGACVILGYAAWRSPLLLAPGHTYEWMGTATILRALVLMLPPSLLSGVLFPLLGEALRSESASESQAAGSLTLANTLGAMAGSLAGGFLLLPGLGMERSFFLLAMLYAAVAILSVPKASLDVVRSDRRLLVGAAAAFAIATALFPWGMMSGRIFPLVASPYTRNGEAIVAVREGQTETILYTQQSVLEKPLSQRLITNSHSMSGTSAHARQYMKGFVYLPVALHPNPERALLISFGCGITARTLTDTARLKSIDVVDISQDILDLNSVVYPDPADRPLNDPRVRVHIEDGRFFLQTSLRQFDLITGEPPPPQAAGVVNLYTREYFELLRDRLAPGGMVTYWLPLHSLSESDSRGIVRSFCEVFEESSLWMGNGEDWILFGVKDAQPRVTADEFSRQWQDPKLAPELAALAFEFPEQLGATFIADGDWLREMTRNTLPLVDNFPCRLSCGWRLQIESRLAELIEPARSRERFLQSRHIARLFPEEMRQQSLAHFDLRPHIHDAGGKVKLTPAGLAGLPALHEVLTKSKTVTPALWMLGTSVDEQRIVAEASRTPPRPGALDDTALRRWQVLVHGKLGDGALARRDFTRAAELYDAARKLNPRFPYARHAYALCRAGRQGDALALTRQLADDPDRLKRNEGAKKFVETMLGLNRPAGAPVVLGNASP